MENPETLSDNENNQNENVPELPGRSTRVRKAPDRDAIMTGEWWNHEDSMNAEVERGVKELRSIQEALNSPEKNHWQQALSE